MKHKIPNRCLNFLPCKHKVEILIRPKSVGSAMPCHSMNIRLKCKPLLTNGFGDLFMNNGSKMESITFALVSPYKTFLYGTSRFYDNENTSSSSRLGLLLRQRRTQTIKTKVRLQETFLVYSQQTM